VNQHSLSFDKNLNLKLLIQNINYKNKMKSNCYSTNMLDEYDKGRRGNVKLINHYNQKCCEVPYCNNRQVPPIPFDDANGVNCWTCKKMTCKECSNKIWSGEWDGETFYKPKMNFLGWTHQVWKCPHCRKSFDRIR